MWQIETETFVFSYAKEKNIIDIIRTTIDKRTQKKEHGKQWY